MRFCMVTTFYPPYHFGGDAIFVQALARALVSRGIMSKWCIAKMPIACEKSVTSSVHRMTGLLFIASAVRSGCFPRSSPNRPVGLGKNAKLRAVLDRDFDVVNFHNISLIGGPGVFEMSRGPSDAVYLARALAALSTHIFWKNHTQACDRPECFSCCIRSGIPPQLWRYTDLIQRSLANVDILLAPSEYTAKRHRAAGLTAPIHVLPMFSGIEPRSPIEKDVPSRPFFLYVGRVTASKGIAVLLEDFLPMRDYDLIVVGDGELAHRAPETVRR